MIETAGIEFFRVSFGHGGGLVLNSVSFKAPPGKVTVLFGPSGAGKTTCLRLAAGLWNPLAGTVAFGGEAMANPGFSVPPAKRGAGFCFQEPALWPALRARKHIDLVLEAKGVPPDQRAARAEGILDQHGLGGLADRYPGQLSGGERKRLDLARALASQPRVLLLDEPLAGVEAPLRRELIRMVADAAAAGVAVLAVTHELPDMYALADHLAIIANGTVLRQGPPREVFRDPGSRKAAELMGHRNFFNAAAKRGILRSPFGEWRTDLRDGSWLAALPPEGLRIAPQAGAGFRVTACRPEGGFHRIEIERDGEGFVGISSEPLAVGTEAEASAAHPPATVRSNVPAAGGGA